MFGKGCSFLSDWTAVVFHRSDLFVLSHTSICPIPANLLHRKSTYLCGTKFEVQCVYGPSKNWKIKIHRTIILPVVLYGCETWSLTLREERMLRAFEKRVLRRIFGSRRDKVTREWRKLHNEELSDMYCSTNIVRVIKSRRMRLAGHVVCIGDRTGVFRGLEGKPEGKT